MEKKITITRKIMTPASTIGDLAIDGAHICHSLELPWKNNARRISCIPPGTYKVVFRAGSAKYNYPHLHALDVPGRDWILFHVGNSAKDSLGCILPGMRHAPDRVTESRVAMNKLMAALKGATDMTLTIT